MAIRDIVVPHAAGELNPSGSDQPWSNPEEYVLFSIDGEDKPDNRDWFAEWCKLKHVSVKHVEGCYKGKLEHAWIANARDWRIVRWSHLLAGQESILHLGRWEAGGREATLWYGDPGDGSLCKSQRIGIFGQDFEQHALAQEAWTFDPAENAYFTVS